MSKVTITVDDTNEAIVAAFGENSIETIADGMGYMEKVEKSEDELPEKVEVETTDFENKPIKEMRYPEGTEMYKDNPETRGQFLGRKILTENIVPALLQRFADQKRKEAASKVEEEIVQARTVIETAATIETE